MVLEKHYGVVPMLSAHLSEGHQHTYSDFGNLFCNVYNTITGEHCHK